MIVTGLQARFADGFQQPDGAGAGDVGGVFGAIEADADVALRGKVVDFVRLDFSQQSGQGAGVRQIAIMQNQPVFRRMRIGINGIQASGVEGAGAADEAVDFVAFGQQQFREVGAVLAGDAGDEGFFGHGCQIKC